MKNWKMLHMAGRSGYAACLFFLFSAYISVTSCVLPKNYVTFHNLKKDTTYPNPIVFDGITAYEEPKILPYDILSISIQIPVQSESSAPLETATTGPANEFSGFQVDKNGYVEIIVLGFVKVAGLTTAEARELIKQKAREYYRDPVVNVRIINFEVNVEGDVNRPGPVQVTDERSTILDVLDKAGGLQNTAKRKDILLRRMDGNKATFVRLDLTKTDILRSPYLYVRQHDVIYVEPNAYKRQLSNNSVRNVISYLGAVTGFISLLFILKIVK